MARALLLVPIYVFLGGTILLLNALQMLTLLIWPVSRPLFRKLNTTLAGTWWWLCVLVIRYVGCVRYVQTGDRPPMAENTIVIANHQNNSDVFALMPFALKQGQLPHLKWFAKMALKWVPGVGWGMQFLDCVFLKRNWYSDVPKIQKTFAVLNDHPIPFWLVTFPEGTRSTPTKLASAREFAKRRGLRPPQHTLIPRTKGFTSAVAGLRRIDAVYDVTIAYPGMQPGVGRLFSGQMREVHVHVQRFAKSDLPVEESALAQWLMQRFAEKDQRLEKFVAQGVLS